MEWNGCSSIMIVSIVGGLRDREVACSASYCQGSNFESCVWKTVSSQSSHHPQEVLLAQFSLYVHKGGLKPVSFHFIFRHHDLQMFRLKSNTHEQFSPLEVVGRGSDAQLQVGENLNYITYSALRVKTISWVSDKNNGLYAIISQ